MIPGDIKNKKIARTYSNALISTADKTGKCQKVLDDLFFIKELINTNNELHTLLYSPIVSLNDKKEVLTKLLNNRIEKITLDFILLLLDNNRINALGETLNQYLKTFNKMNNIITPTIISAVDLEENQKTKIVEKLNQKLLKTIKPDYKVNPDIIGGLIIEIEDKTLDFSLKSKFDDMKKELTKGNRYGNN